MINEAPRLATGDKKTCPRCASAFVCKPDDIANCPCSRVKISVETRAFLAKTHFACLCGDCLAHYEHLHQLAQGLPFPTRSEMLIEDLHYYRENGFWVFTELYHFLRGTCCGSGCRHCAYGFVQKR